MHRMDNLKIPVATTKVTLITAGDQIVGVIAAALGNGNNVIKLDAIPITRLDLPQVHVAMGTCEVISHVDGQPLVLCNPVHTLPIISTIAHARLHSSILLHELIIPQVRQKSTLGFQSYHIVCLPCKVLIISRPMALCETEPYPNGVGLWNR